MRNPVFVVGAARSGTTLLSVLLDRHSQLAMTPETGFYRELAPWLRLAPLVGVEFLLGRWRRLPELGLTPAQLSARCGRSPQPGALLNAMLDLYASAQQKPRCGEKTRFTSATCRRFFVTFPTLASCASTATAVTRRSRCTPCPGGRASWRQPRKRG